MMKLIQISAILAFASSALAQTSSYCNGGVCYAVNIPAATASSGSGDIFFQISGPTSNSWIGLGQGSSMSNSNIFMIYANADGTNVTLSPRTGTGDRAPSTDSSASVTLVEGSGIIDGQMIANVRCSNCNSWSGGSMSFTDASSNWIYAYKSGSAISSDSLTVSLSQHSTFGTTTFNLQNAAGGSSANPFSSTAAGSGSNSGSSGTSQTDSGGSSSSMMVLMAHAILAPVAFVLFFPLGAMIIRIGNVKNLIWIHAGWMGFSYILAIASIGMGISIAVATQKLNTTHAVLGLFVVGSLLLQPVTGLAHHALYKRKGGPNAATYPHVWWGRAIITLGMINGGLGLKLSDNSPTGTIAYGVVAAIMWVAWMAVIAIAFMKSRNKSSGARVTEMAVFGNNDAEKLRSHDGGKQLPPSPRSGHRPSFSGSDEIRQAAPARGV